MHAQARSRAAGRKGTRRGRTCSCRTGPPTYRFNIAGANGDKDAQELRDNLERDLTRAEISRATELARACMALDQLNETAH